MHQSGLDDDARVPILNAVTTNRGSGPGPRLEFHNQEHSAANN
jgi:hypothetical protein